MDLASILRCPNGHTGLQFSENQQMLTCPTCAEAYPVRDGVPVMFDLTQASESDRKQIEFFEGVQKAKAAYGIKGVSKSAASGTFINRLWRKVRVFYNESKSYNELLQHYFDNFDFQGGERVLEIGCALGTPGTQQCLKNKEKIEYVGLDFVFNSLVGLREVFQAQGAHHFSLVNASVLDDRLAPGSFDVIFGSAILHHFDELNKQVLAKNIFSWLKPNGKAFFLEPLNTNPIMRIVRGLSAIFRPNLAWEHPFNMAEVRAFTASFDRHHILYYDALAPLSLAFGWNGRLFRLANNGAFSIDRFLEKFRLFRFLFNRMVVIVFKAGM
jgi:uncharacterized protein YbaR (Trm112 family)/SAM-dependent methyltransferase